MTTVSSVMLAIAFLIVSVSLTAFAATTPTPPIMTILESLKGIPDDFIESGPAALDTSLQLRISLTQANMTGLESELYAVSTPGSDRYGQYLSKEEVEQYVKPTAETVNLVNEWLIDNGISSKTTSPAGDWLQITLPVGKANSLLDTDFKVFTHQNTGNQTIRTLSYSIPSNLTGHINLIHPTIAFPIPFSRGPMTTPNSPHSPSLSQSRNTSNINNTNILTSRSSNTVPSSCADVINPACLQALYGIPTALATQPLNVLAVSGFADQYANKQDLQTFLTALRPDISPATSFSLQVIDDGMNPQTLSLAGLEANTDIQYTVGIAQGVPVTFISVGDTNLDGLDGFIDLLNFLLGMANPPRVLTTSYGLNENAVPAFLAMQFCSSAMQLGSRGVSILFPSGDGGVSGVNSKSCTLFMPTFPSGCPFVTSVGATTGINPETAAPFSSGGFSSIFSRPAYQSNVVSTYLTALGTTNSGDYIVNGRGFPDVSAQGDDVEAVYQNEAILIDGTSVSSPIWASIVALLNDELLAAGKPVLGFLNPFLYSAAASTAFTDITSGNNPGCNTDGFPAHAGWDPVTGLGTPNYVKLRMALGLT